MQEKRLQVIDTKTGVIEQDVTFDGGYNITYQNNRNDGAIYRIHNLNNARYGNKHWIMNYKYETIARALILKFPEFGHLLESEVKFLFIEDTDYTDPENGKYQWKARIKKCSSDFVAATGYNYIIETRRWFISQMKMEQVIAVIYHELRHIALDGTLMHHDIEDWSNMVATLGKNWTDKRAEIINILSDEFDHEDWAKVMPTVQQLTFLNTGVCKDE